MIVVLKSRVISLINRLISDPNKGGINFEDLSSHYGGLE